MVGSTVVDGSGKELQNAVGWVGGFEKGLWQSVGMWLVVVGWQAAGQLFPAVGHCSFGMWLGCKNCWGLLLMVIGFRVWFWCVLGLRKGVRCIAVYGAYVLSGIFSHVL